MGNTILEIKMPTNYSDGQLREAISRQLKISDYSFQIESKSLDARNKQRIFWLLRIGVSSKQIKGSEAFIENESIIEYRKRNKKVVVVGSGPAGFFAALVLQLSGFETIILERGSEVGTRAKGISGFEKTGVFNPMANYSFGEGGAGTFSDGKLTSRSKHISRERAFFLNKYIEAGAPPEIAYLAHPHVGSDKLRVVVKNLREKFIAAGGIIHFETTMVGFDSSNGIVSKVFSSKGEHDVNYLLIASGHSAYETYRLLINQGVQFRLKNFAIGSRAEHEQRLINKAQWGVESLPGLKAAEYRLSSQSETGQPVYSFCMCPGGIVVPAAAYDKTNIVNGMSYYKRGGKFANAACVAGIHPSQLSEKIQSPLDALSWIEDLEGAFYDFSQGFKAPASTIKEFLEGKIGSQTIETSYPLGYIKAPIWEMLPAIVVKSMRRGLNDFSRKLKGYEYGNLLGLESKTSSPIQVIRENSGFCTGFENLAVIGEGSGYAGGIVSSAADGIRVALTIIN